MRDEIKTWVDNYQKDRSDWENAPIGVKPPKTATTSHKALTQDIPRALKEALVEPDRYEIKGSDGSANWAKVSWVVVRDPGIAPSTQEGYYVVFLLSQDGLRLYLSINQGCTALKTELGDKKLALEELKVRAATMRRRIGKLVNARYCGTIQLGTSRSHNLGPFYEAGHAVGIQYDCTQLPSEGVMRQDFISVVSAYKRLMLEGGWHAAEDIEALANSDGFTDFSVIEKKRYAYHRITERNRAAANKVKDLLPDECMGCGTDLKRIYGEDVGTRLLEAHHLMPLHTLSEGTWATYRLQDFALLCPNCHRAIHRIGPEKLKELQELTRPGCGLEQRPSPIRKGAPLGRTESKLRDS